MPEEPTPEDYDAVLAIFVTYLQNASGNSYSYLEANSDEIGAGFNSLYIQALEAITKVVSDLAQAFAGWLLGKLQELSDCISEHSSFMSAGNCLFMIWRTNP